MNQSTFVNSLYYIDYYTNKFSEPLVALHPETIDVEGSGGIAFPYSLYFVFYDQYTYVQGVAIQVRQLCAVRAADLS